VLRRVTKYIFISAASIIVLGVVFLRPHNDLIQKLPSGALGIFVWKNGTPLHREIVRRFGDLTLDNARVSELLTGNAKKFALVVYENPWRAAIIAEGHEQTDSAPRIGSHGRAALRTSLLGHDGALIMPRIPTLRAVHFTAQKNILIAHFKNNTPPIATAFPHIQNDVAYLSVPIDLVYETLPLFQNEAPLLFSDLPPLPQPTPSASITCSLEDDLQWLCGIATDDRLTLESFELFVRAFLQKIPDINTETTKAVRLPDGEIAHEKRHTDVPAYLASPRFVWNDKSLLFGTAVMHERSVVGWSFGCSPDLMGTHFLWFDMTQMREKSFSYTPAQNLINLVAPFVRDVVVGISHQGEDIICF